MPIGNVNSANEGGARTGISINLTNEFLDDKEQLRQKVNKANSNVAARRQFRERLGLANYQESSDYFRSKALQIDQKIGIFKNFQVPKGTTLDDFKAIKKEQAGYRPFDFKFQYGYRAVNNTLADFNRVQQKYWLEQDEFMSINTDKLLTKQIEAKYTTLIEMEDEYRLLVESGDVLESYVLKDKIERFKASIDLLKIQRVDEIS